MQINLKTLNNFVGNLDQRSKQTSQLQSVRGAARVDSSSRMQSRRDNGSEKAQKRVISKDVLSKARKNAADSHASVTDTGYTDETVQHAGVNQR